MSKAAETEKRIRRYRDATSAMARLLEDYANGETTDDQNVKVDANRIASEYVAKYRAMGCCLDHNKVSFDGPMIEELIKVMRSAYDRGVKEGLARGMASEVVQ